MSVEPCIKLKLEIGLPKLFFPLIEKGVKISLDEDMTAMAFLSDRLGLSSSYIDERVQTVFINSRPVDNLKSAMVTHNCIVALSAAMPGLLGATMRKGGRYAAFRTEISHNSNGERTGAQKGRVTLKMFNLLLREIGPGLFKMGVIIQWKELLQILTLHQTALETANSKLFFEHQKIRLQDLLTLKPSTHAVSLKIQTFS